MKNPTETSQIEMSERQLLSLIENKKASCQFGGKRPDLNNQYFRSKWEANYARFLNWLISNKQDLIEKWQYEPDEFEFPVKRGTRFYKPDFKVFFKNGRVEYHEVKGYDYQEGITARKRMAKYYPDITLILIDSDWFKDLRKKHIPSLIEGWE